MRRAGAQALHHVWRSQISHSAHVADFAEQVFSPHRPTFGLEDGLTRQDFVDEFSQPLNKSKTLMETLRSGPLCTEVLLNVPQNKNCLDYQTSYELLRVLRGKRDGRALKALLLRGVNSEKSNYFCGGFHWEALREMLHEENRALLEETIRCGFKLLFFVASSSAHYLTAASLPFLMGIINGRTESIGTGLALYTDFACAMRTAEICFTGPEKGLPVHGGVYRLLAPVARRFPGVAQYLLCTPGVPLYAADAMRLGLIQLRVSDQPELSIRELLSATGRWDYHTVAEALLHAQDLLAGEEPHDPCTLTEERLAWIAECFGLEMDLERIIFNLEAFRAKHKGSSASSKSRPTTGNGWSGMPRQMETPWEWADKTLAIIRSVSPTALKVSLELLRRAQQDTLSLSELLRLEFRAVMRLMRHHDFHYAMQRDDDLQASATPGKPPVFSIRSKPLPRVAPEFSPNDVFEVSQADVEAILEPFDWEKEGLVDFDAINETWAEDDIIAHVNRAQAEKRVETTEALATNRTAVDAAFVPVTDIFGELAQLWTEMGAQDDVHDRIRWPNHLEHFKAFEYLFDGPTAAKVAELQKSLALYERLLTLDGMERQLAQQYLWEKWDRYLPVEDEAPKAADDQDLVTIRFRQLYDTARQLKQLRNSKYESTTDLREVSSGFLGTSEDAAHETAASLEARLRHAVLLTSEVDLRVIQNARTALAVELEGREEIPSQAELMDLFQRLVREEVMASVPDAVSPDRDTWSPDVLIDPQQGEDKNDLTEAHLHADGKTRPRAFQPVPPTPSERLTLPMESFFERRIQHVMSGWPLNQQQILIAIEVETAKRLKAQGIDLADPALDVTASVQEAWKKAKFEVMRDRRVRGLPVVLDVQPRSALKELQGQWSGGYKLYPHEERMLWSGETTYPAGEAVSLRERSVPSPPPIPPAAAAAATAANASSAPPSPTPCDAERAARPPTASSPKPKGRKSKAKASAKG
eukprot:GGOE01014669.1.p1 GENE.GGOE01014669.1~~GGOE01014669.1.p1  ORF type:complete len:996 (-),score=209.90 GGOE01014669.1:132-3080(-)